MYFNVMLFFEMEIDMEIDNKPGIQGGEWCAPHRGTP
jgi:hypothetical protein